MTKWGFLAETMVQRMVEKNKKDKYLMIQSVECIMERVHSNELSLGNNILDHMTVNISQTKVTTLIAVGQLSMVNPEKV